MHCVNKNNSRILSLHKLDDFALKFVATLKSKDIVALTGTLGAGKTTFVNAVMRHLKLANDAAFSSPTFTILNRYTTRTFTVYHVDLYRLKSFMGLEDLDILDLFGAEETVTFIEWADKFVELTGYITKKIHFDYVHNKSQERLVSCEGFKI